MPSGGGSLSFWVTRHTEPNWDFVFVEAHTVGQDDWTTLPDENGHTSQDTGFSCPFWHGLHPFLAHYQTDNGDGTCSPEGSTGDWWAASGLSDGYEQWQVDLAAYAGKSVEVSITYASDDFFQIEQDIGNHGPGGQFRRRRASEPEGEEGAHAGADGGGIEWIDAAPELDGGLRVQYDSGGDPRMLPVGSRSIRRLVEERQPVLALHGHIHEGRGRYKLGRTVGINPGSQYQDGVLMGVLVRVSATSGVRDVTFTAG